MFLRHHWLNRISKQACLLIGLIALQPRLAAAASGITLFDARCTDAGIVVHFIYVEDPLEPTGHPEWTQYALSTLSPSVALPGCGSGSSGGVLEYFPRSGATDDITYVYPHQEWLSNRSISFYLEAKDANYRNVPGIHIGTGDRSACPIATTPVAIGTISEDLGWAVRMEGCPCTGVGALVKEPQASQLRPYAGTTQVLLLYGEVTCTPAECSLELHHFELMDACPERPVPTRVRSWGQLKMRYR